MSTAEIAYLGLIVGATVFFMAVLAWTASRNP